MACNLICVFIASKYFVDPWSAPAPISLSDHHGGGERLKTLISGFPVKSVGLPPTLPHRPSQSETHPAKPFL